MKRKLLLLAMLFCCLLLSACHTKEPASTPIGGTSETKTSAQTIVSNTTVPKTTPPSTPLETTPPETSPPETIPLPLTEASVREAFAKFRPDYTLKEFVETDAGYFLFSMLSNPTYSPQYACERNIDFLDKSTGAFAKNYYSWLPRDLMDYCKINVTGYNVIDDYCMYVYAHGDSIFYNSGHRGVPEFFLVISYQNGELNFTYRSPLLIFYPLSYTLYKGYNDYAKGLISLSAAFSSRGSFSLLFDATGPDRVTNLILPRVNMAYDAEKHQMTLTCTNILADAVWFGDVPVPADDPYMKSVKMEKYEDGIRVTIQLKPEAELYIPWEHSFERRLPIAHMPAVLFNIEFADRKKVTERDDFHILDKIVYICEES